MKDLPVRVAHRTNTPCGPDARAQQNPPKPPDTGGASRLEHEP